MSSTLSIRDVDQLLRSLSAENRRISALIQVGSYERQPVHTMIGGAHLFKSTTIQKISEIAIRHFSETFSTPQTFMRACGVKCSTEHAREVHAKVKHKLESEAVEDYRIDFEDGFGVRTDEEEDAAAVAAARELAASTRLKKNPPSIGIRVKSLSEEFKSRCVRTLDLFLTQFVKHEGAVLPQSFVVCLPKVSCTEHVSTFVNIIATLEERLNLKRGSVACELMVETPESIIGFDGRFVLRDWIAAAEGRCRSVHLGAYDYTASLQIAASDQTLSHPSCDFARHVMQVALAHSGVRVVDGATTILPIGPFKPAEGRKLTTKQKAKNRAVVVQGCEIHAFNVRRALHHGIRQGWDLHPAQLMARYGTVYSFILEHRENMARRLSHFLDQAAQASRIGESFDDAATGQGLLNFFLHALSCGAMNEREVLSAGLSVQELQTRSFSKILDMRRVKPLTKDSQ